LVIILKKSPEKSAKPVSFINRFVVGIENLACISGVLFYKLCQIFIFLLFFKILVLRVTFFCDACEEMLNINFLFKYLPDIVDVLASEILTQLSQLPMKVQEFRL